MPLSLWIIVLALIITGLYLCTSALNTFVSMVQLGPEGWFFKRMLQVPEITGGQPSIEQNKTFLDWGNLRLFIQASLLIASFVGIGVLYMRQAWRFLKRTFSYRGVRTYLALWPFFSDSPGFSGKILGR